MTSPKRTFFILGGLLVAISLPTTIILSQQSQDLRQHASGGCHFVGGLCISYEGPASSEMYAPKVPDYTSVDTGGVTYQGNYGTVPAGTTDVIIYAPMTIPAPGFPVQPNDVIPAGEVITPNGVTPAPGVSPIAASPATSPAASSPSPKAAPSTSPSPSPKAAAAAAATSGSFEQTQCYSVWTAGTPWNGQAVKCKPGCLGSTCGIYTWQLDSGGGSCPGGFQCGSSGACTPYCSGAKCDLPGWGSTTACVRCDTGEDCGSCSNGYKTCTYSATSAPGSLPPGGTCWLATLQKACTITAPTAIPATATPLPPDTNSCTVTTGKPLNCVCTQIGNTSQCATGYCGAPIEGQTGANTCQNPPNNPNPSTPVTALCDPNGDGKLDTLDFQWWKDEYFKVRTTKLSSCFVPGDPNVTLLDFQAWKNRYVLKISPSPVVTNAPAQSGIGIPFIDTCAIFGTCAR